MSKTVTVRAAIAAVLAGFSVSAYAIASSPKTVDIPAGELRQALLEVAEQFDADLVYSLEQIQGIRTSGAHGELTSEQAVTRILEGTRLEARIDSSGAMLIAPSAAPSASSSRSASPSASGGADTREAAEATTEEGQNTSVERPSVGEYQSLNTQDGAGELQSIMVVGTRIHNVTPTSPVIVLSREDIDRSGATTIQNVLAGVSQNYSGVDAASSRLSGGNTGLTSEIDLRGLGSEATLTLVNGRRVSTGAGDQGRAVDISMIPLAAIDRIDILTDGASALYGSDAIGGVVNLVLRQDFEGAQTTVHHGWNAASADSLLVSQLAGTHWDTGRVLAAVQYQRQDALKSAQVGIHSTDFRARGGGDFRLAPFGAPGTVLPAGYFNGQPFSTVTGPGGAPVFTAALPAGSGRNLQPGDLLLNQTSAADLVTEDLAPKQESKSAYVTVEQDIGSITLFADGAFSQREAVNKTVDVVDYVFTPATNAFTPLNEPVMVAYQFKEFGPTTFRIENNGWFANAGARGSLPVKNWTWEVLGTTSRDQSERLFASVDSVALAQLTASSDPAVAFNPFGDGSGQSANFVLPTTEMGFKAVTHLRGGSVNLQGDLWELPAGAIRVATGTEYRTERLDGRGIAADSGTVLFDDASRDSMAVFAELYIPLFGGELTRPGLQQLALSVAGRYEDYSDFGSTSNPKVGVLWQPLDSLVLKANWGTSFRAPLLRELSQTATFLPSIGVFDPLNPGGPGIAFVDLVIGGNPNLEAESAETFTASGEYRPQWLPDAKFSIGYFHTNYDDRIRGLLDGLSIDTLLSFQDALPPGIAVRDANGALTLLNVTNINSAKTKMSGIDLAAGYDWLTERSGRFSVVASGTVLLENEDQLIAGAPALDLKGTVGNPAKWRARLDLSWSKGPWGASLVARHTDGLLNTDADPKVVLRKVDSQTVLDAQLSLKLSGGSDWASGVSAQLGATNLFNERSPFVDGANNFGVDPRNFDIQGRTIYARLSKAFGRAAQ